MNQNDIQLSALTDAIRSLLLDVWVGVVEYLPRILIAGLILLAGFFFAYVIERGIRRLSKWLRLDDLLDSVNLDGVYRRFGITVDVSEVFAWLFKWSVVLLALVAVADVLNWTPLQELLAMIVEYVPTLVVSVLILLVGVGVSGFLQDVIYDEENDGRLMAAIIVKWGVIIFAVMAALIQLGIAEMLINTLFIGIVAMVALGGGLAFGLGGREHAKRALDLMERSVRQGGDEKKGE